MKTFCKDLKNHAVKIINYEITLLTAKERKSYRR